MGNKEEMYRSNVGIIIANDQKQVFWGRRRHGDRGWQFPQGGIQTGETLEVAMYRELREETGLYPHHVKIMGRTQDWLYYDVPKPLKKYTSSVSSDDHGIRDAQARLQTYLGQKQIWFLLQFQGQNSDFVLDTDSTPEFDEWCWQDYWATASLVIEFKREVYRQALSELSGILEVRSPSVEISENLSKI